MNRLLFALALMACAYLGAMAAAALDSELSAPPAACDTDAECMRLCADDTANLPPDHPDYCDGGPQR
jgi:hypothetical protein